ncbi:unnamed protein product [Litomosoides sigmodontis]|uniref:Uncharacterized protein n=1 Tax=Litomosoides sigmodontis TaxID=42156 RepID=A0A3P6TUR2_LITSI|nr:unnamed protein product [Litomosoides sigmodontis]
MSQQHPHLSVLDSSVHPSTASLSRSRSAVHNVQRSRAINDIPLNLFPFVILRDDVADSTHSAVANSALLQS